MYELTVCLEAPKLLKSGHSIKPTWEDSNNKAGGNWSAVRINKKEGCIICSRVFAFEQFHNLWKT